MNTNPLSDESRVGLLPAAGMARRLDIETPKELLIHDGRPIIDWSVDHMVAVGVERIVVVIRRGKESVLHHLEQSYPSIDFEPVYQAGEIGNLLDALSAAVPALGNDRVLLRLPDTKLEPVPFCDEPMPAGRDLIVHCFESHDMWMNFGVLDRRTGKIVDKPATFISPICWGALEWSADFTARLHDASDFTTLMNAAPFEWRLSIASYVDIGLDRAAAGLESSRR